MKLLEKKWSLMKKNPTEQSKFILPLKRILFCCTKIFLIVILSTIFCINNNIYELLIQIYDY
jgi:hypothetical protein